MALLAALLTPVLSTGAPPVAAAGETLAVSLALFDGTAPFDPTDDPGQDSSDSNGLVRTNDNVTYAVEISVNDASASNVTFTLEFPQGMEANAVPPYCGAGSSLTPPTLAPPPVPVTPTSWTTLSTQTLVCNAGPRTAFSTFTYPVVATVRPEVPNATVLAPAAAEVVSDDVPVAAVSNEVDVTVSARAQFDISKNSSSEVENRGYFSSSGLRACADGSGRTCQQYNYPVLIAAPGGAKGSSPLLSPVTFTDDLSIAAMFGAGALTDPDYLAAGAAAEARYGAILAGCRNWTWQSPNSFQTSGTEANSVRDSGTTTCTQPGGPGTPAFVSIANMDSSGYTTPVEPARPAGVVLPANRGYVYSAAITVQIPIEAVIDLGTESSAGGSWTLNWRNEITDFAPAGFDGIVNDPDAQDAFNDYRASTTVASTRGTFDKYFVGVGNQPGNLTPTQFNPGFAVYEGPIGSTGIHSGEGQVFPGEQVLSMLNFSARNGSTGIPVSFIGCDAWDPALLQLNADNFPSSSVANGQRLPSNGAAVWVHGHNRDGYSFPTSGPIPPNLRVEYGNGVAATGVTCDDADSPGGWHANPADVPGNDPLEAANGVYSGVSMVRVHLVKEAHTTGNGTWSWVAIGLRATPGLAPNTLLPNYANVMIEIGDHTQEEMLASADSSWSSNTYVPETNEGRMGDRLWTGGAVVRLAKEVRNPATGNWVTTTPAVTGGQQVDYRVRPTLTGSVSFPVDIPVQVEDCLPTGQSYVASTLSPSVVQDGAPADAELACPAGRTYIRWDIPAATINQAITPIEYTTTISPVASSGVQINDALVSAPGDPSALAERTAEASVQVTQPAGIELDKVALTPIVEVNRAGETNRDPLIWRVDMANIDTVPGPTDVDIIDILPANGIGATSFSGTLAFDSAQVVAGGAATQILYTAAAPATIDIDAFDSSNDALTGTTIWCDLPAAGAPVLGAGVAADCPASPSDVSGLRIVRPGPFGPGSFISAEIEMTPSANSADDVYENVSAARGVGLILPVGPVSAIETVVSSSIGDLVWEDSNGNGVFDLGEPPIDGIVVSLSGTDSDGNPVALNTVTSGGGRYDFSRLQSGDYDVTFALPPTSSASLAMAPGFTFQQVGTVGGVDSDGDPITGQAMVTLNANSDLINVDQGILYPDPSVTISKLLNGDDANTAPGHQAPIGSTIAVTFDVVNDGNIVLSPVVITDDTIAASDITCPASLLAPGATFQCTASLAAPGLDATHTNTATVTATPAPLPDGALLDDVTDTDVAHAVSTWAEISGHVFADDSNDGVFDPTEMPLSGVMITLFDDAGVQIGTTQTNAQGLWEFRGLTPGTYRVVQTHPASHLDGIDTAGSLGGDDSVDDELSAIAVIDGDRATDYNFGELSPASVSGSVVDTSGSPIENVVVTLTGTDDLGNAVTLTVTTAPDGSWEFAGLRPGSYAVVETQPVGVGDGPDIPGGPAAASTANDTFEITLAPGDDAVDNVFTEKFGSISGTVFHDHDNNGVQDPGDAGIPGVALALRDPAGNLITMVTTTADGDYLFAGLLAGGYNVAESTPINFDDGIDTLGDLGGDDSVNDQFALTLPAGHDAVDYDFAEIGTSITGTVWLDENTDGVFDPAEPGRVAGATVTLVDVNGSIIASTVTDAAGFYVFDDLFPGDYTVLLTQPATHGRTTTTELDVTLPVGGLSDVDFGLNLGSVSGSVWDDSFGDGILVVGEPPVAGVEVVLSDDFGIEVARTTTDAAGNYEFTGLPIGTYSVQIIPPVGSTLTLTDQGADDTIDSEADQVTGHIEGIVVACPGAHLVDGCNQPLGDSDGHDAGIVASTVDLSIEKTLAASGEADVGDLVEWSIEVRNNGNTAAASTLVIDELPPELAFVSASGPEWTCVETLSATGAAAFECLRSSTLGAGDVAPAIRVVTSVVAHPVDGTVVNRATVEDPTTGISESSPSDNASNSELAVIPPPTIPTTAPTTLPSTTVAPTTVPSTTVPPATTPVTTVAPTALPPTTTTVTPISRPSGPLAFSGASSLQLAAVGLMLAAFGAGLTRSASRKTPRNFRG